MSPAMFVQWVLAIAVSAVFVALAALAFSGLVREAYRFWKD